MPLQKMPLPPIDAALDPDTRQARQACEELCRQTRREWERKYALFRTLLLVFGVVAALAMARVMRGG